MKLFLVGLVSILGALLACSSYKSAGSPSLVNNIPTPQASGTPAEENNPKQTSCDLSLAQAPVINGLKLKMTPDEVLSVFPGSQQDEEITSRLSRPPSQFGESNLLIKPNKYESKDKFTGINQIVITFLDGRVSSFNVAYNGPEYPQVDDFVAKFVEGRNLPPADQWQAYAGMDNQLKVLTCKSFEVRIFAGGAGGNLNSVAVKNLEADRTLKGRRAKAIEKMSPTP